MDMPVPERRRGGWQGAFPALRRLCALTGAGWLAAMIPQEYGGSGLGLTEASVVMEEINQKLREVLADRQGK